MFRYCDARCSVPSHACPSNQPSGKSTLAAHCPARQPPHLAQLLTHRHDAARSYDPALLMLRPVRQHIASDGLQLVACAAPCTSSCHGHDGGQVARSRPPCCRCPPPPPAIFFQGRRVRGWPSAIDARSTASRLSASLCANTCAHSVSRGHAGGNTLALLRCGTPEPHWQRQCSAPKACA